MRIADALRACSRSGRGHRINPTYHPYDSSAISRKLRKRKWDEKPKIDLGNDLPGFTSCLDDEPFCDVTVLTKENEVVR